MLRLVSVRHRVCGFAFSPRFKARFLQRNRRQHYRSRLETPALHQPRPKPCQVLDLSLALCNALEYLHDVAVPGRIVCHRDLKPDNIGFAEDGALKLIDFGLGKVREGQRMSFILRLCLIGC